MSLPCTLWAKSWKDIDKSISLSAGGFAATNQDFDNGYGGHARFSLKMGKTATVRSTVGTLAFTGDDNGRFEDFDVPFYFTVGGEAHFKQSGKWDSYFSADVGEYFWKADTRSGKSYQNLDFGLSMGGGVNWEISDRLSIPFDAVWHWIFLRQNQLDVNYQRLGIEATVGLRWTLGKKKK